MWIARDYGGTFAFENKPELDGERWCIYSGFYFEIPDKIEKELLGRKLKSDETIEVELKKL